jgi:hypothetical protein
MTISEIKALAKETFGGRKQSVIQCEGFKISIVGGDNLYGDFENTFEIAIIDQFGNFITKQYVDGLNDDVIGYYGVKETEELVNRLLKP